jgi:replicative DNA helicase
MEQAVLGVFLAHANQCGDEILATVKAEDFFIPNHAQLFLILADLHSQNKTVDMSTVYAESIARKIDIGAPAIFADLANAFSSHYGLSNYTSVLIEKSRLRRLQKMASAMVTLVAENNSSQVIVAQMAGMLESLEDVKKNDLISPAQLVTEYRAHLASIEAGEETAIVPTGYYQIDAMNGGFPVGLTVISARPGNGKTVALLNLMENWCDHGRSCGLISLEMGRFELTDRVVGYLAGIDTRKLKSRLDSEEKFSVDYIIRERLAKWKYRIYDGTKLDVTRMRWMIKAMVRQGCDTILLDYLQLMDTPLDKRQKYEKLGDISRALKMASKEFNIPIVVAAQLNRDAANGEPGAHHIRESGNIEQDADVIILLSAKDQEDKGPTPHVVWDFVKFRGGVTGKITMTFDKTRQRFIA